MTGTDYCGKHYYKSRSSDVTKHLRKCLTGSSVKPEAFIPNQSETLLPFISTETAEIDFNDLAKVNLALRHWIYANCRPYHIANDRMFTEFIQSILEVGAKHGKKGFFKFDLSTKKPMGADSVRKGLDSEYTKQIEF